MDADRTNTVHTDTSHSRRLPHRHRRVRWAPPSCKPRSSPSSTASPPAPTSCSCSSGSSTSAAPGRSPEPSRAPRGSPTSATSTPAHNQLRVARALREFPQLDSPWLGVTSPTRRPACWPLTSTTTNAAALIGIAERTPAGHLGAAVAAWSQHHDDPEQIRARQHQARSCSWRCDPDGMITLTARMTPHVAAAVCAVIDTHVMHTNPTPDAPAAAGAPAGAATAPETGAPAPAGAIPSRPTLAQQRHDALAHAIAHGGEITTEVVVHVTADGNHLTDGTPLSDHAVTNLLPDAHVALLLHDTRRHPIDASPRRRSPTRRQRRVLDARQPRMRPPRLHLRDLPPVRPRHPLRRWRAHHPRQPPTPVRPPQPRQGTRPAMTGERTPARFATGDVTASQGTASPPGRDCSRAPPLGS